MAPARTRTVKNKHAATKQDTSSKGARKSSTGKIAKSKRPSVPPRAQQLKERNRAALLQKPKRKTYTEEQLGIPKLNMITPVGVVKPPGKKKGKVFVDDTESMNTILAIVQAEKAGQIESKMIKARQLEEIRDARQAEAEKKDQEKNAKLENAKDSLRKKRNRKTKIDDEESIKAFSAQGSKANKPKKRVSFA